MKEFDRTERIGAELRRELVAILRDEVRDPRLHRARRIGHHRDRLQ